MRNEFCSDSEITRHWVHMDALLFLHWKTNALLLHYIQNCNNSRRICCSKYPWYWVAMNKWLGEAYYAPVRCSINPLLCKLPLNHNVFQQRKQLRHNWWHSVSVFFNLFTFWHFTERFNSCSGSFSHWKMHMKHDCSFKLFQYSIDKILKSRCTQYLYCFIFFSVLKIIVIFFYNSITCIVIF